MIRAMMGRFLFFLGFLTFLWTASETQSQEITQYNDLFFDDPSVISRVVPIKREDIQTDIDVLERILSQGYAGWEAIEHEGVDWAGIFGDLRRRAGMQERWSVPDFLALLLEEFSEVNDGHLGFFHDRTLGRDWRPVRRSQDPYFSDVVVREDDEGRWICVSAPSLFPDVIGTELVQVDEKPPEDFLFPTLPSPGSGARHCLVGRMSFGSGPLRARFRRDDGKSRTIHLTLHRGRSRLSSPTGRTFRLTYVPYPRIELGDFSPMNQGELNRFLATADRLRQEDVIVIDLRGNVGGRDGISKEWLEDLSGLPIPSWEVYELVSPVTLQGDVILHDYLFRRANSVAQREQAGGRLAYAEQRLKEALATGESRTWREIEKRASPGKLTQPALFDGKLILIVDRGTQSSAETFVLQARNLPGTLVFGENTAGMARFGEMKLYRLPHSGLWLQAGSKRFEDPTGEFQESVGFLPDYWLDASNPISVISDWLRGSVEVASGKD